MNFTSAIEKNNFRLHLIEGALYISTAALLSPQTMFPALVQRLGGSDLAIGAIPVVVYLAYFLPQLFSANYFSHARFRKPFVLKGGLIQRLHILLLAIVLAIFGASSMNVCLIAVFCIYALSQALSGSVSPLWTEFIAKTNNPSNLGKLFGLRNSLGASLGVINGFILAFLLGFLSFPWSYVGVFLLAFLLQSGSLIAQRSIVESHESKTMEPFPVRDLLKKVAELLKKNKIFKKFLISAAFLTLSFSAFAFYTVAGIKKYALNESYVGIFIIITVVSQIISSAFLGWLSDKRGCKLPLMICAASNVCAACIATVAQSVNGFYAVFIMMGINLGSETMLRYNFAVDCSSSDERAIYIGLMNAWLAPFYFASILAGWISGNYGYTTIFVGSLFFGCIGTAILWKTEEPRRLRLALSLK